MRSMVEKLQEIFNAQIEEYRRVEIPLVATLAAAGTTYDTYKVPAQYKLAIERISAHLALMSVATEPLVIGNFAANDSLDVLNRIAVKAMNCRISLINSDTSIYILGGGSDFRPTNLASLMAAFGGKERDYTDLPALVRSGETLRMDATVVQSGAGIGTISTEYGVVLSGILVRTKGDR